MVAQLQKAQNPAPLNSYRSAGTWVPDHRQIYARGANHIGRKAPRCAAYHESCRSHTARSWEILPQKSSASRNCSQISHQSQINGCRTPHNNRYPSFLSSRIFRKMPIPCPSPALYDILRAAVFSSIPHWLQSGAPVLSVNNTDCWSGRSYRKVLRCQNYIIP